MPKIIIREVDNTVNNLGTNGTSYDVFLLGLADKSVYDANNTADAGYYDENDVAELNSIEDLKTKIGLVGKATLSSNGYVGTDIGNQEAYELLKLGYKVYYKIYGVVGSTTDTDVTLISAAAKINGTDGPTGASVYALGTAKPSEAAFWAPFKDKAVYDFRFIANSFALGCTDNTMTETTNISTIRNIQTEMIKLAAFDEVDTTTSVRGDAIALCDIPQSCYSESTATGTAAIISNIKDYVNGFTNLNNNIVIKNYSGQNESPDDTTIGKYAAFFVPDVCFNNVYSEAEDVYEHNHLFPASFYYLACFAKSIRSGYKEWFAIANTERGISDYTVNKAGCKLGEIAINELEPRTAQANDAPQDVIDKSSPKFAVNVIANFRGNYYLWGNRTACALLSGNYAELKASHFLNIRQLCVTLSKYLYKTCRKLTFEQNSDLLWNTFYVYVSNELDFMKGNQGIEDYSIERVKSNKRATLAAIIHIQPIEAVEDFDITVSLENNSMIAVESNM